MHSSQIRQEHSYRMYSSLFVCSVFCLAPRRAQASACLAVPEAMLPDAFLTKLVRRRVRSEGKGKARRTEGSEKPKSTDVDAGA